MFPELASLSASLLAPAALGLLALGLLPFIAHLIRRPPRQRVPFGPMMLLLRLTERVRRRRRIDDLLLLLLRILLLLLLLFAVTQPRLQWPAADLSQEQAKRVVFVLDNSLSMAQQMDSVSTLSSSVSLNSDGSLDQGLTNTAFSTAVAEIESTVLGLPDGVELGLVMMGGEARTVTESLIPDKSVFLAQLREQRQSYFDTDLSGGLREARRLLDGNGGEVMVFTDESGEGVVVASRAEISLMSAQKVSLIPRPIRPAEPSNLTITQAHYGDGAEGGSVHFTVHNYGSQLAEAHCTVHLPGGVEIDTFVEVAPGESAETFVTVPRVSEGGVARVSVADPSLQLDNDLFFQLPRIGASRVLVIDGEPGSTAVSSEVYFLERALSPWGRLSTNASTVPDVVGSSGIDQLDNERHRVVFMANVADPSAMAGRLTEFVRGGGGLIISLGDNVTAERYNQVLDHLLPLPLRKAETFALPGETGRSTAAPELVHDLFRPFSRGGLLGFKQLEWSRVFSLKEDNEESTTVLMRLDNGYPLLIQKAVGAGNVLLLTSSIDLEWGNFPLQSVFMPLVQRMVTVLGGSTGGVNLRSTGVVGERGQLPLRETVGELVMEGPLGSTGLQQQQDHVSFQLLRPGPYRLAINQGPTLAWIAANTNRIESDVRAIEPLLEVAAEVDPERFLKTWMLAPWLILLALALALVQALLSRKINPFPGGSDA